jgi:hypothetical protein
LAASAPGKAIPKRAMHTISEKSRIIIQPLLPSDCTSTYFLFLFRAWRLDKTVKPSLL